MDAYPILFPAITNRESWAPTVGLVDIDAAQYIDLTGWSFVLEVRRGRPNTYNDYTPVYDYGGACDGPLLRLTSDANGGITAIDVGVLQISVTLDQMRSLDPDTYSIAMTATNGTDTRQLFLGRLPVLYGGVT